jgi:hypothetical protein
VLPWNTLIEYHTADRNQRLKILERTQGYGQTWQTYLDLFAVLFISFHMARYALDTRCLVLVGFGHPTASGAIGGAAMWRLGTCVKVLMPQSRWELHFNT